MKNSTVYRPVTWMTFAENFNKARGWVRIAENCATLDNTSHCVPYMSNEYLSGFAIHKPTKEIRYLHSVVRGRGDMLVTEAIKRGGAWLTCFDGYLKTLYERHGFKVAKREPNWTAGKPDVLTMIL